MTSLEFLINMDFFEQQQKKGLEITKCIFCMSVTVVLQNKKKQKKDLVPIII